MYQLTDNNEGRVIWADVDAHARCSGSFQMASWGQQLPPGSLRAPYKTHSAHALCVNLKAQSFSAA